MASSYELPVVPRAIKKGYWSPPSTEPSVRDRWILTATREQQHPESIFWMGDCLYCASSTWRYADGGIDDYWSHHGLVTVVDPESGVLYRACSRCAADENRASSVIATGRARLEEGDEDVSPIQWHDVAARVAAIDDGKTRIRMKVVRRG